MTAPQKNLCPCGSGLRPARCCQADGAALSGGEAVRHLLPMVDRAIAFHGEGKLAEAEALCLDVLELAPGQGGALAILSQIRKAQGVLPAAEALIRRMVALDPNNVWATQELALLLFGRGAFLEAEIHARNAVRIAPTDVQSHNLMGMIMTELNRPQVGEFHYRRALELLGARPPILLANLAWNLKNQGKMEECRALYKESVALDPNILQTVLGWSRMEETDRDFARADALLDQAEKLAPGNPSIELQRAVVRGRTKNYDAALSLLDHLIYEFSGANGEFLGTYRTRAGVTDKGLTTNYRSVEPIVSVANKLAGRTDGADRKDAAASHAAYFVPYKDDEKHKLLELFASMLTSAKIEPANAVVLCRASKSVEEWRGGEEEQGQGTIKEFVAATICRDKLRRYDDAFGFVCSGVVGLLADKHGQVLTQISRGNADPEIKRLKRALWAFARDPAMGLPSGALIADTQWHPALLTRVKKLLADLKTDFSLASTDNIGLKLAKKALLSKPLISLPDLASGNGTPLFRVSTVHQVKGESIDGVMYVADKKQVRALLDGTGTELGRIGYVAVTRARNLMVLGVPEKNVGEFETELIACGFKKAGS